MCLVAPEIAQYEEGIQTLQTETAARKETTKEKEADLAQQSLAIFQQLQVQCLHRFPNRQLTQTTAYTA